MTTPTSSAAKKKDSALMRQQVKDGVVQTAKTNVNLRLNMLPDRPLIDSGYEIPPCLVGLRP